MGLELEPGAYMLKLDTKTMSFVIYTSSYRESMDPLLGFVRSRNSPFCDGKVFVGPVTGQDKNLGWNPAKASNVGFIPGSIIKILGPDGEWYFVHLNMPDGNYVFDPASGGYRYNRRGTGDGVRYAHTAQNARYDPRRGKVEVSGFNAY